MSVVYTRSYINFVLSEKLCQDSLESFFARQRAAQGHNDNPTVHSFCLNTVSLRVQGSTALNPISSNCGKRPCTSSSDDGLETPLLKRPRYSKSKH